jgi:hypothetical protein
MGKPDTASADWPDYFAPWLAAMDKRQSSPD